MEMTRECISFAFDLKDMLLSLQIGASFARAAMACAILERISGFESSSERTALRYLKLLTVSSFCPFTLISHWMPLAGAVCHQFGQSKSHFSYKAGICLTVQQNLLIRKMFVGLGPIFDFRFNTTHFITLIIL